MTNYSGHWRDRPMNELAVRLAGVLAELGVIEVLLHVDGHPVRRLHAGRDDLVGAVITAAAAASGTCSIESMRPPLHVHMDRAGLSWRTPDGPAAAAFSSFAEGQPRSIDPRG